MIFILGWRALSIEFHDRITAHLTSPVRDGMFHLCLNPFVDGFATTCAAGLHEDERVHERIINRSLQTMLFAKSRRLTGHPFLSVQDKRAIVRKIERRRTIDPNLAWQSLRRANG